MPDVQRGVQGSLLLLHHELLRAGGILEFKFRTRRFRAFRDRAEVIRDQFFRLRDVDVAGNRERRVVWDVPRFPKVAELLDLRLVNVLHRADGRPRVGRVLQREADELLEQRAVGLVVVAHRALLLHDLALRFHALLVNAVVHHALALDPERELELVAREIEVVVRLVEARARIEISACAGDELVNRSARDVHAALEHEVLEKMREARAVWPFVLRADVVEHVARDDWRGVIFMQDHMEAVRQIVFGESDRLQRRARGLGERRRRERDRAGEEQEFGHGAG